MRRAYRYRLYPTRRQAAALEAQLDQACDLYNAALQHRRDMWRDHGQSVSFGDQSAELCELRSVGLLDSEANGWSQQAVLRRLDRAFGAFFRRVKAGDRPGYPRFKSRRRFDTLEWSFAGNAGGVKLTGAGRLRLQGVGHVKVRLHRPLPTEAKLCQARVTHRIERYDTIYIEALHVRGLARGMLAKDCTDQGWAAFAAHLARGLGCSPQAPTVGAEVRAVA